MAKSVCTKPFDNSVIALKTARFGHFYVRQRPLHIAASRAKPRHGTCCLARPTKPTKVRNRLEIELWKFKVMEILSKNPVSFQYLNFKSAAGFSFQSKSSAFLHIQRASVCNQNSIVSTSQDPTGFSVSHRCLWGHLGEIWSFTQQQLWENLASHISWKKVVGGMFHQTHGKIGQW